MQLKELIEILEKIHAEYGNLPLETALGFQFAPEDITLDRDEDDDNRVIGVVIDK
jgi:hypothetical protein